MSKYIRCINCNYVNWDGLFNCEKCGVRLSKEDIIDKEFDNADQAVEYLLKKYNTKEADG